MDLIDRLKLISERVNKLKENVLTEEATKNAFVMPFLQALGYDVFNPLEVVPEFVADVGIKKGEKIDYCIMKNEEPAIFIECKHWKQTLSKHNPQLLRYFHVTPARFAILTNGIIYQFFTDLEKPNIMDTKPFLEFSLENVNSSKVNDLKQFHKENFDISSIIDSASELKYSKEIREIISSEFTEPSDEFTKFFARQVYNKKVTSNVLEMFRGLVKKASRNFINNTINDKLQAAINTDTSEPEPVIEELEVKPEIGNGIETTEEELQGFRIVQAIMLEKISNNRIAYRDKKTYFGILLDDNNRKPICRLHFNGRIKYLEVFDDKRKGQKVTIEQLSEIYNYKKELLDVIDFYDIPS